MPRDNYPPIPNPSRPVQMQNARRPAQFVPCPTPTATPSTKSSGAANEGIKTRHAIISPHNSNERATRRPTDGQAARPGKVTLEMSSAFPPLPPPLRTPSSPPAQHTVPRSLRITSTPKATESPALPSPVHSIASKVVPASHRPDTPVSEMVSDNASLLSASVAASRAGSPPPSKIGSAAVRNTTKSKQRKQRKEAQKQETKAIVEMPKATEAEEHAPVIGRKKKQKKEKPAKAKTSPAAPEGAGSTEAARTLSEPVLPGSPGTTEVASLKLRKTGEMEEMDQDVVEQQKTVLKAETNADDEAGLPRTATRATPEQQQMETSDSLPAEAIESEDPADRQQFGIASIFSDIKDSLWTAVIDDLLMFKPVGGNPARAGNGKSLTGRGNLPGYCRDRNCKCSEIQAQDLAALRDGKAVRKQNHVDGSRMLITPNGDSIRALSPEEEDRFLDLQKAVGEMADHPAAFVAARHQSGSGAFTLTKGRAVPNGRPNIFPTSARPSPQDAIGKLQREDALSYINQYVLPRLNLDGNNMGLPRGIAPLRDAASASLNALAPYFYGPDAAAGVGIYCAPEGGRLLGDCFGTSSDNMSTTDLSKFGGFGAISLMEVEDAEARLATARKEAEKLEKGLNAVMRRNKKLLAEAGN